MTSYAAPGAAKPLASQTTAVLQINGVPHKFDNNTSVSLTKQGSRFTGSQSLSFGVRNSNNTDHVNSNWLGWYTSPPTQANNDWEAPVSPTHVTANGAGDFQFEEVPAHPPKNAEYANGTFLIETLKVTDPPVTGDPVPEPRSILLLGSFVAGLILIRGTRLSRLWG
jgi:hypothetical protein